jgi:hypothetical protein
VFVSVLVFVFVLVVVLVLVVVVLGVRVVVVVVVVVVVRVVVGVGVVVLGFCPLEFDDEAFADEGALFALFEPGAQAFDAHAGDRFGDDGGRDAGVYQGGHRHVAGDAGRRLEVQVLALQIAALLVGHRSRFRLIIAAI